jgi:alkaline phosphatase
MRTSNSLMALASLAALLALLFAVQTAGRSAADDSMARTKNVILLIGDGMGYNQIEAASLYRFGAPSGQAYYGFPVKLAVSTYSASGAGYDPQQAWGDFEYVKQGPTDSAAAATAMATGEKTINRYLGLRPDGTAIDDNLTTAAEAAGLATGLVTTVPITHATPAGFIAHNKNRYDFIGIADEMINRSGLEVLMGAGHPFYDNDGLPVSGAAEYKYVGGAELWQALEEGKAGGDCDGDSRPDPWSLTDSREEIVSLGTGPAPKRLLAVVKVQTTTQQRRRSPHGDSTIDKPYEAPLTATVPTLPEMVLAAINVLDDDPDGFFLMIEGGAIDWACEDNESGRLIEEQIDFDRAVEAVIDWVERNSNWDETLVIVTADHESGYLLGPGSGPEWKALVNNGVNKLPGMEWHSGTHTNSLVPLFAKGSAVSLFDKYADENDPVRGRYIDNTEIAKAVFEILNAKRR